MVIGQNGQLMAGASYRGSYSDLAPENIVAINMQEFQRKVERITQNIFPKLLFAGLSLILLDHLL